MGEDNSTDTIYEISLRGRGIDNLIDNLEKKSEAGGLEALASSISKIYLWPLFVLGVPANLLALMTILTLKPLNTASFFVALLAVCDGTTLIAKFAGHQLAIHHVYMGDIGCKFEFLVLYFATMANWLLIFICVDRFLTVCYLRKKAQIWTTRRCCILVSVVSLILLVFFATFCVTMRRSVYSGFRCGIYQRYVWFWKHVWYWMNATVFLFIPLLFFVPMTGMTVWTLYKSSRARKFNQRESENHERAEREGAFTLMAVLAVLVFVVLSLPACIYYLSYSRSSDVLIKAHWTLFEQIQFVLVDSTHAINFFLYFLSSKLFREQLFKLLTCKLCRGATYSPEENVLGTDIAS